MLDSTYKLNSINFPVRGLGYTDENRNYHLLRIAMINKETTEIYYRIFCLLTQIYIRKYNISITLKYVKSY